MSPPLLPTPVPLVALTPDHLKGVSQVHAFDPTHDGPGALLSIPGRGWMPTGPERTLVVHIDRDRAATDLITLRGIIATAAAAGPGSL